MILPPKRSENVNPSIQEEQPVIAGANFVQGTDLVYATGASKQGITFTTRFEAPCQPHWTENKILLLTSEQQHDRKTTPVS